MEVQNEFGLSDRREILLRALRKGRSFPGPGLPGGQRPWARAARTFRPKAASNQRKELARGTRLLPATKSRSVRSGRRIPRRLIIDIESVDEFFHTAEKEIEEVLRNPPPRPLEKLSFSSATRLRRVLTPRRQFLVRVIRRKVPQSVYALAKMLGRDRKTVSEDLKVLAQLGLVKLVKMRVGGRLCVVPCVPYDEIEIRMKI